MAWIELHDTLPDHPKVSDLAHELAITEVETIGYLACLWLWASRYAPEGVLSEHTSRAIARGAKWGGEPDQFTEALIETAWADNSEAGIVLHNWELYAGRLAAMREANRDRKRQSRARHAPVTRTKRDMSHDVTGLPNLTKHNQTKPVYTHTVIQALVRKTARANWQWAVPDKIDAVRGIVDAEIARLGEQKVVDLILEKAATNRGAMYVSQLIYDIQWPVNTYKPPAKEIDHDISGLEVME